jgi:hypothetical protein
MNIDRGLLAMVSFRGKLYALLGDECMGPLFCRYNPRNNYWTKLRTPPAKWSNSYRLCASGDAIYLFHDHVEKYHVKWNIWVKVQGSRVPLLVNELYRASVVHSNAGGELFV